MFPATHEHSRWCRLARCVSLCRSLSRRPLPADWAVNVCLFVYPLIGLACVRLRAPAVAPARPPEPARARPWQPFGCLSMRGAEGARAAVPRCARGRGGGAGGAAAPRDVYEAAAAQGFPTSGVGHSGRLDAATTGVLLMCDDAALGVALKDPAYRVPKEYVLTLRGRWRTSDAAVARLREPLFIEGQIPTRPAVIVEVEAPERVDDEAADVSGRRGSGSGSGVALCAANDEVRRRGASGGAEADFAAPPSPPPEADLGFGGAGGRAWCTRVVLRIDEGRNRQIRRLCTRSRLRLCHLHRRSFAGLRYVRCSPHCTAM